jgi:hypothetical protein|tara:strand:+ start:229 stop:843 length:615 start_codon:yes stop_codon:yes gene_type:complete
MLSSNSHAKSGNGELKLTEYVMEAFLHHIFGGKNLNPNTGGSTDNKSLSAKPLLFVVADDSSGYSYLYCPFDNCKAQNEEYKMKLKCQKLSSSSCWTFSKKTKIIWKNSKNPNGLELKNYIREGKVVVANIIKDAGFYDGDIDTLVNIDPKTGERTNISISGQKLKNQNKGNTVEQLETLSKLYKAGLLTESEYNEAKSKVLND